MTSLPDLAQTLQTVLIQVPQQHARSSGVTQRRSKLRADLLVQTLVLGWLAQAQSTLEQLCQMAARRGVSVTPQGLDQRFTPALAGLLQTVLEAAIQQVVQAADP